ncbi:hypothetical protein [Singulisphaera acidiphila]|uniref:hypothetical protein n=1 Tax=Singulisphaera acidiphila TaxID=466153 RepID=UPI00024747C8|nr:hypothetical protein [Singulisphaera acidiphila]
MHIDDRHAEDRSPRDLADPAGQAFQGGDLAPADHVIAGVDRLEQGIEMGGRPTLLGCRHQDERDLCPAQALFQSPVPASSRDRDDHALDGSASFGDQRFQGCGHLI